MTRPMDDRERIFKLIETADNFVKYAGPGREQRGADRARKRYMKAARLAEGAKDDELLGQIKLRLEDLDRRATLEPGVADTSDDSESGGSILTSDLPAHAQARVPPHQRVTRGWPVLHEGPIPRFDPESWRLTVDGACEAPFELTYVELKDLPNAELTSDFHCVTGWSKLDNLWRGVQTRLLLERASPRNDAAHVLIHAEYGYTANVPLERLMAEDALVTWMHNGSDLAPKHGFPLRALVPPLYAWKSVKWVRRLELLTEDRRGFWEVRGYHNRADPWLEERYSYQEQ
ncbi:MAG: sulfite oxidase-like oxidoreductase [Actinomycetota bacterium]